MKQNGLHQNQSNFTEEFTIVSNAHTIPNSPQHDGFNNQNMQISQNSINTKQDEQQDNVSTIVVKVEEQDQQENEDMNTTIRLDNDSAQHHA